MFDDNGDDPLFSGAKNASSRSGSITAKDGLASSQAAKLVSPAPGTKAKAAVSGDVDTFPPLPAVMKERSPSVSSIKRTDSGIPKTKVTTGLFDDDDGDDGLFSKSKTTSKPSANESLVTAKVEVAASVATEVSPAPVTTTSKTPFFEDNQAGIWASSSEKSIPPTMAEPGSKASIVPASDDNADPLGSADGKAGAQGGKVISFIFWGQGKYAPILLI
jgi:hypothetical protein